MSFRVSAIVALAAVSAIFPRAADASTERLRASAIVAGVPVACRDFRGVAVETVRA
jgi:hypothetical protein